MKKYAIQIGLIFLGLAVIAAAVYGIFALLRFFENSSYKYVLFFLFVILISNVLARITYKYFEI